MPGSVTELENYKTLLTEIELENTKIGKLETRASETQKKISTADQALQDYQQDRQCLIEEEVLGGETHKAIATLIEKIDCVREQQSHDRELLEAVHRTKTAAEQKLTTMKSRLRGQRNGAWGEIIEKVKAQRPEGMDAYVYRVQAAVGSANAAMAILCPPVRPSQEGEALRREIAKEFGLVE